MAKPFADILDECLDRLQEGETVEQCLSRYPEFREELEPLLKLGCSLAQASAREVRPLFRSSTRYQLVSEIDRHKPRPRVSPRAWWRRGWVVAVTVIALLLLAGGSAVAASSNSLPDQPLYPVKLTTEKVRLALTFSETGKAKLHVQFAEKRLEEMVQMARKNKPQQIERLAEHVTDHLDKVPPLALKVSPKQERELGLLMTKLAQSRNRAVSQLRAENLEQAPPPARQALRRALERAQQRYQLTIVRIQPQNPGGGAR